MKVWPLKRREAWPIAPTREVRPGTGDCCSADEGGCTAGGDVGIAELGEGGCAALRVTGCARDRRSTRLA